MAEIQFDMCQEPMQCPRVRSDLQTKYVFRYAYSFLCEDCFMRFEYMLRYSFAVRDMSNS